MNIFDFNNNGKLDAFDLCILEEIEKEMKEKEKIDGIDLEQTKKDEKEYKSFFKKRITK